MSKVSKYEDNEKERKKCCLYNHYKISIRGKKAQEKAQRRLKEKEKSQRGKKSLRNKGKIQKSICVTSVRGTRVVERKIIGKVVKRNHI